MTRAAASLESQQQRYGLKSFTVVIVVVVAIFSVWLSHIPNSSWSSTCFIPASCALHWFAFVVNEAEVLLGLLIQSWEIMERSKISGRTPKLLDDFLSQFYPKEMEPMSLR